MWPVSQNNLRDFWYYLTGASGENGQTPHIGNNMNWWIGNKDTGIRAQGRDGQNGEDAVPPVVTIGDNGNWLIDGVDTGNLPEVKKELQEQHLLLQLEKMEIG